MTIRRLWQFFAASCIGLTAYFINTRQTADHEAVKPAAAALAIPAPVANGSDDSQAQHKDSSSPTSTTLEAAIPTVKQNQRIALLNEAGRNLKHVYDRALQSTDASEIIDALIAAREGLQMSVADVLCRRVT